MSGPIRKQTPPLRNSLKQVYKPITNPSFCVTDCLLSSVLPNRKSRKCPRKSRVRGCNSARVCFCCPKGNFIREWCAGIGAAVMPGPIRAIWPLAAGLSRKTCIWWQPDDTPLPPGHSGLRDCLVPTVNFISISVSRLYALCLPGSGLTCKIY